MLKTREITTMQLRERFGQYIDEVQYKGDCISIIRKNKPIGAIISNEMLKELKNYREEKFKIFSRLSSKNKGLTQKQLDKYIKEAKKAIYKK